MRGKGFMQSTTSWQAGITPACAGKSCINVVLCFFDWDHPRVCGEKKKEPELAINQTGSPPRVRGKGICLMEPAHSLRITPACAGKRMSCATMMFARWDHPRVCGEKTHGRCSGCWATGSPPRVRGKGENDTLDGCPDRITPACAGKREPRR